MKVAIMQPYFFPYLGYWQLMNAVDKYVIFDDVNYIKRGWIHRNRILVHGQAAYFNLPKFGGSQNQLINEVKVNNDPRLVRKNLSKIEASYKKAPYYADAYPIVRSVLECGKENTVDYLLESFRIVGDYLGIKTELIMSSHLEKDCSLRAQEKVLAICKILEATEYYNTIGGKSLYSYEDFSLQGIKLKFLKPGISEYEQFGGDFVSSLSIIDVMMFNSRKTVQKMLREYELE